MVFHCMLLGVNVLPKDKPLSASSTPTVLQRYATHAPACQSTSALYVLFKFHSRSTHYYDV